MDIDKSLSTPLYQQIKEHLESKIMNGEWVVGRRLPTEKDLAVTFNVSNITIKRALHELVNDGMVERYSGKGTFVTGNKEDKDISTLVSLRNEKWDENTHYPHKTIQFNVEKAGDHLANVFNIDSQDFVYNIIRVKMENDKPVVLEHTFLPYVLFQKYLRSNELEENLIYNVMVEKFGVKLNKAKIYFSTKISDKYEQQLLNITKDQRLFIFDRYTVSKEDHIVEYSRFVLEQSDSKFFLEIKI